MDKSLEEPTNMRKYHKPAFSYTTGFTDKSKQCGRFTERNKGKHGPFLRSHFLKTFCLWNPKKIYLSGRGNMRRAMHWIVLLSASGPKFHLSHNPYNQLKGTGRVALSSPLQLSEIIKPLENSWLNIHLFKKGQTLCCKLQKILTTTAKAWGQKLNSMLYTFGHLKWPIPHKHTIYPTKTNKKNRCLVLPKTSG